MSEGLRNADRWIRHYKWLFGLALIGLTGLVGLVYEQRQQHIEQIEAALAEHLKDHREDHKEFEALKDTVIRLQLQNRRFPSRQRVDPMFGGGRGS